MTVADIARWNTKPISMDTQQVAEWTSENNVYTRTNIHNKVIHACSIQFNYSSNYGTTNTRIPNYNYLEQIKVLFNPSIQLQSNSNPLVKINVLIDTDINFSSNYEQITDISTLTFAETFQFGFRRQQKCKDKKNSNDYCRYS